MARPLKYETEEDLTASVKSYFADQTEQKMRPSKAGLRVWLGFSKSSYHEYKERFPNPIKEAEDIIEVAWVQRLDSPAATGAIFYLKNAFKDDYRDRHETDITSGGDKIIPIYHVRGNNSPEENIEVKEEN